MTSEWASWWQRNKRTVVATGAAVAAGAAAYYAVDRVYRKEVSRLTQEPGLGGEGGSSWARGGSAAASGPGAGPPATVEDVEATFTNLLRFVGTEGAHTWSARFLSHALANSDVVRLTAELRALSTAGRSGAGDVSDKLKLWDELKVATFAESVGVTWSLALLHTFVSAQLMIIGRLSSSHGGEAASQAGGASASALEGQLDAMLEGFFTSAVPLVSRRARAAAESALAGMDLRRPMRFSELLGTLAYVSCTTEFDFVSQRAGGGGGEGEGGEEQARKAASGWAGLLLRSCVDPGQKADTQEEAGDVEDSVVRDFRTSLADVLAGVHFDQAVSACARCTSNAIIDHCRGAFIGPGPTPAGALADGAEDALSLPLAKVVPMVSTATQHICEHSAAMAAQDFARLDQVVRVCADAFSSHRA